MKCHIVTANACLSVCPPLRYNGANPRADRFADSIYMSTTKELDVICLQELIVHRNKVLRHFTKHPHHTTIARGSLFNGNIRFVHSGLAIVSKWPIVMQDHFVFQGLSYHAEMFMSKAILYAKIHFQNKYYINVFVTHVQAWCNETAKQIRLQQFVQMHRFINALHLNPNEPVVLCGDFNIDFYEHSRTLEEMMQTIDFTMHMPSIPQFSFDPTLNLLVGTDDANEYATRSQQHGCYEEYLNTGICSCCPKQLIDGIATSNQHLQPLSSMTSVLTNVAPQPFQIFINVSTQRMTQNVSDHFAVLTELEFSLIETSNTTQKTNLQPVLDWHWICLQLFLTALLCLLFYLIRRRRRPTL